MACRYCPLIDLFLIKDKNKFQDPEGIEVHGEKRENHIEIRNHAKLYGHNKAIEESQRRKAKEMEDRLSGAVQDSEIESQVTTYNGMYFKKVICCYLCCMLYSSNLLRLMNYAIFSHEAFCSGNCLYQLAYCFLYHLYGNQN